MRFPMKHLLAGPLRSILAFLMLLLVPAVYAQAPGGSVGGFDQYGNTYPAGSSQYFATSSWTYLTSAYTNATTGFTSSGLVLPKVPTGMIIPGHCVLLWQTTNTSGTLTLGLGLSNANSTINVLNTAHTGANGATLADVATTITTSSTTTAISGTMTAGTANTTYRDDVNFLLTAGAGLTAVTIYGESSSASYTVSLQPGSYCTWGS